MPVFEQQKFFTAQVAPMVLGRVPELAGRRVSKEILRPPDMGVVAFGVDS
jgi:hypothetical protein